MNIANKQEELQDKILKVAKDNNLTTDDLQPIYDGVADVDAYLQSSPKILWVLKEPYDYINEETGMPEGGGWKLMDDIEKGTGKVLNRNFPLTLQRIIYATRGIDTGEWYEDMWDYRHPEMYKYLFQIGYVNISKMPAFSRSGNMMPKYRIWKDVILEQISLFNPDIIIFGNTFKYMKDDFLITDEDRVSTIKGWANLFRKEDTLYVDAYHPGLPGSTEDYVNSIIEIVSSQSKQK